MKFLAAVTICLVLSAGAQASFLDDLKTSLGGVGDAFKQTFSGVVEQGKQLGTQLLGQLSSQGTQLLGQAAQSKHVYLLFIYIMAQSDFISELI